MGHCLTATLMQHAVDGGVQVEVAAEKDKWNLPRSETEPRTWIGDRRDDESVSSDED